MCSLLSLENAGWQRHDPSHVTAAEPSSHGKHFVSKKITYFFSVCTSSRIQSCRQLWCISSCWDIHLRDFCLHLSTMWRWEDCQFCCQSDKKKCSTKQFFFYLSFLPNKSLQVVSRKLPCYLSQHSQSFFFPHKVATGCLQSGVKYSDPLL